MTSGELPLYGPLEGSRVQHPAPGDGEARAQKASQADGLASEALSVASIEASPFEGDEEVDRGLWASLRHVPRLSRFGGARAERRRSSDRGQGGAA